MAAKNIQNRKMKYRFCREIVANKKYCQISVILFISSKFYMEK